MQLLSWHFSPLPNLFQNSLKNPLSSLALLAGQGSLGGRQGDTPTGEPRVCCLPRQPWLAGWEREQVPGRVRTQGSEFETSSPGKL